MINKYPGTCQCGTRVEASQGTTTKIDGRWAVRCASCAQAPTAASFPDVIDGNQPHPDYGDGETAVLAQAESYTLLSGYSASPYQAEIFDHFKTGRGSAIVKAVAGSGKTTTIKNAIRYLPPVAHVQLFAFNVEAAAQLKSAIAELELLEGRPRTNVRAGTFHSVGFGAVQRKINLPKTALKIDDAKCRRLLKARLGATPEGAENYGLYGAFATALAGYAKGEGIGALVPDTEDRWYDLVDHHGLYLDSEEATVPAGIAVARRLLAWSNDAALAGSLDYDDMLYLVVLWKLRLWQNHVVVCDEAQDTNPVRRAMLRLALRPGGRLYAVGDPKQSIYGFTGASTDAMDLIAREFNTRELPLTVSYRCARSVVERAQTWVPYIEASPNAPAGSVRDGVPLAQALAMLTDDDAVLCRQTAPLVALAYGLIARGRPVRLLGREIGEGLVNLVKSQRARGIDALLTKLEVWRDREAARFTAKGDERRAEAVADRVECLVTIIDSLSAAARTVPALLARIAALFETPNGRALTLATIHKAKGMEWPTVAILRPELMPSRGARQEWQMDQEQNLQYVAATRAKTTLIYIADEDMNLEVATWSQSPSPPPYG